MTDWNSFAPPRGFHGFQLDEVCILQATIGCPKDEYGNTKGGGEGTSYSGTQKLVQF